MKAKAVLLTVLAMSIAVMLAAGPAWAKQEAKVSEQEAAQSLSPCMTTITSSWPIP